LISHPDEIEKIKHFIGQADPHRQIGLKRGSWEGGIILNEISRPDEIEKKKH